MFARRVSTLQGRNRGGLGAHAFGHLSLSEACFLAGLEQRIEKSGFFALDTLDFRPDTGALNELLYDLIKGSHA